MSEFLHGLDRRFRGLLRIFLCGCITIIAFLMVFQVFLRYVLKMPMHYVDEILTLLAVWLYLLGGVSASADESHINARILEVFSKKIRFIAGIRLISAAVSIIVISWLTYWAYFYFEYTIDKWRLSLILHYPMPLLEAPMFFCFLIMIAYAVKELCKYFKIFKDNDTNGVEL